MALKKLGISFISGCIYAAIGIIMKEYGIKQPEIYAGVYFLFGSIYGLLWPYIE